VKIVVITGSTRGIGYGLAASFLDRDCAVVISGRSQETVDQAVARLTADHPAERILGQPCDVTDFQQVQALWDAAHARFGRIDIWINNAGLGHAQVDFWELPADKIAVVIGTNLLGAMLGCKVAVAGMLAQGFGAVYNLEGLGSGGPRVPGTSVYATSKAGLRYFDETLMREVRGTPVIVGALQPGMVITDLVMGPYEGRPEEWQRARRIFNIIADRVETVTPWLACQVLANDKNGARISWSSTWKVGWRFLTAPFRKRDLFDDESKEG
jgi:NAD(P)-dependent dehydrogenase (short-subunit alcohol dehydrogenase family)